uniref:Beta-1,4-galactosyltransferase n=1 Tax=Arion vulgaris TaxID=1028688 RepID=A0A0B7B8W5_9EUPU
MHIKWMARQLVSPKCRSQVLMAGLLLCFMCAIFMGIALIVDSAGFKKVSFQLNDEVQTKSTEDHTLCVLVPFRNRFEELLEFAPHVHKFLNRQNVNHKLVVINQQDQFRFNRASLINAGFLETRSFCDYIAMHDVDLLPMNGALSYAFPELGPFHLSAPHLHPLYHYRTFVGGILLIQSKHFEMLNGLSNRYWGWGREDDEFFVRMKKAKLMLGRPANLTTGYRSFRHIHDRNKRPRDQNRFFDQFEKTRRVDKETGVSTVKYKVDSVSELVINEAPVTIINVSLECDIKLTPWCLQADDHAMYNKTLLQTHPHQPQL